MEAYVHQSAGMLPRVTLADGRVVDASHGAAFSWYGSRVDGTTTLRHKSGVVVVPENASGIVDLPDDLCADVPHRKQTVVSIRTFYPGWRPDLDGTSGNKLAWFDTASQAIVKD